MMHNIELIMQNSIQSYRDSKRSPLTDRHMNNLKDKDKISQRKLDEIIQGFWEYVKQEDIPAAVFTKIELLDDLKKKSIHYVNNYRHATTRRMVAAVLVSFINWVGYRMEVDYAIYARDINRKVVMK